MKKRGGEPITLATSHPITLATSHPIKSTTKLPKIKKVISSNARSKNPLRIPKLTIRKGGDILDVLESYENNNVDESIIGGKSKKKGGNQLIDNFKNILNFNETFDNNDKITSKNTGVLG